jgi:predicted nucleic-acid-binding protein
LQKSCGFVHPTKLYNQPRLEVVERLIALIGADIFYHPYKSSLIYALYKYSKINLDFVDCLAISYQETGAVNEVITFDTQIQALL